MLEDLPFPQDPVEGEHLDPVLGELDPLGIVRSTDFSSTVR